MKILYKGETFTAQQYAVDQLTATIKAFAEFIDHGVELNDYVLLDEFEHPDVRGLQASLSDLPLLKNLLADLELPDERTYTEAEILAAIAEGYLGELYPYLQHNVDLQSLQNKILEALKDKQTD